MIRSSFIKILCLLFLLLENISFCQEEQKLKTISSELFISENPSTERIAITSFIVHQFDDKRKKGVTQAQLNKLWNSLKLDQKATVLRIQIVNQKLYADYIDSDPFYVKPLLIYFQKLLQYYQIKDIDFIIYTRDEILKNNPLSEEEILPLIFMMSKNSNSIYEKDTLLIPDAHMIDLSRGWQELITVIEEANKNITWDKKINKIFWRGGATGWKGLYHYNVSNFDKLVRLKLAIFSKLYPDLIDAEITAYYEFSNDQDGNDLKKILDYLFNNKQQRINEVDHLKYKYLIAVDGNTCPWLRIPWIMLSNSVLLKQETSNIEWFYPALKAYTHYIPIKENLADIFDRLDWMKDNDSKVKEISFNAQNFVKNNLMPEHLEAYFAIILNEYSSIQKDSEIKISLPKAEDILLQLK